MLDIQFRVCTQYYESQFDVYITVQIIEIICPFEMFRNKSNRQAWLILITINSNPTEHNNYKCVHLPAVTSSVIYLASLVALPFPEGGASWLASVSAPACEADPRSRWRRV